MFISTENIIADALGRGEATSSGFSSELSELPHDRTLAEVEDSVFRIKSKVSADLAGLRSRLQRLCRWAELVVAEGVPNVDFQQQVEALHARALRETEAKNQLHAQLQKYRAAARDYPQSVWRINKDLFKSVEDHAAAIVQEFQRAHLTLKRLGDKVQRNANGEGMVVRALGQYRDAIAQVLDGASIGHVHVGECDGQPFYTVSLRVPTKLLVDRKTLRDALQCAHELVERKMPEAVGMFAFRWEAAERES